MRDKLQLITYKKNINEVLTKEISESFRELFQTKRFICSMKMDNYYFHNYYYLL